MRKPWEAPDLRHLQQRRQNTPSKIAARALAEALVPEDFVQEAIDFSPQWPPEVIQNLLIGNWGIRWRPMTLKVPSSWKPT